MSGKEPLPAVLMIAIAQSNDINEDDQLTTLDIDDDCPPKLTPSWVINMCSLSNHCLITQPVFKTTLGQMHCIKPFIDTGTAPPCRMHPYRVPNIWDIVVRAEVKMMLEQGIIKQLSSPWFLAMVCVHKKNSACRISCNHRQVNAATRTDPYFMPMIDDMLDCFGSAQFIHINLGMT